MSARAGALPAIVLALLLAGVLSLPRQASAFGTIAILGQHSEHQRITRWALEAAGMQPRTMDQLAGTTWTFGAVGAPDKPWRGLVNTKAAHCDGGDYLNVAGYAHAAADARSQLEACRAWMFDHLRQAVTDASGLLLQPGGGAQAKCHFGKAVEGGAKCRTLADLGLAFHAAQDFYAHTNWVDDAASPNSVENPPGLNRRGPAPWIDPSQEGEFPVGLISGCWDGVPERFYCAHGGAHPRVAHADLNKDEGSIDVDHQTVGQGDTRRGKPNANFEHAVRAAVEDTAAKWSFFEAELTRKYGPLPAAKIICRLTKDAEETCR